MTLITRVSKLERSRPAVRTGSLDALSMSTDERARFARINASAVQRQNGRWEIPSTSDEDDRFMADLVRRSRHGAMS